MGDHILPANPTRDAHDFRTDTVGFLAIAEMGRSLGEVAYTLPDRAFLRGNALLRGIISMCNSLIISIVILQNTST